MVQTILPIFPKGATNITSELYFECRDNIVTYFHGGIPVFCHEKDDIQTFKMIISQFYVNGHAKQSHLAKAFGITKISLKRSVKIYKEKGCAGFYEGKKTRGAEVLTTDVLEQVQQRLDNNESIPSIATEMGLKQDTLRKAVYAGRLKKKPRRNAT
jgi:transposase-like protein